MQSPAWRNLRRVAELMALLSKARVILLLVVVVAASLVPALQVLWISGAVQAVSDAVRSGGLEGPYLQTAIHFGVGLGALALLLYVATMVEQYVADVLRLRLTQRINEMVMQKATRLDLAQFENSDTYDKLQRASQESGPRIFDVFLQFVDILRHFLILATVSAVLFTWNPLLAIIILLSPIPGVIANARYGKQVYETEYHRAADHRRLFYYRYLTTNDGPVKEVRLFGLAALLVSRYGRIMEQFFVKDRSLARYQLFMVGGLGLISVLMSSGAILVALTAAIRTGKIGELAGYLQAIESVQTSATALLLGVTRIYQNVLFLGNLLEFMDLPHGQIKSGATRFPEKLSQGIEFCDVTFTYPGTDRLILDRVSFTIPVGKCVALVGENGAGKTTIVKLLTRLYEPDSGNIFIDGVAVSEYDLDDLRAHFGVIFQDFIRYEMTVRENIGFGHVAAVSDDERINRAAAKAGADSFIADLDDGLDATLGRYFENGQQLSTGQWQKIALARAFMRQAPIIVLDEPTASIDAKAESEIFEKFRIVTEGTSALLIAHRFSTIRLADHIVVLESGRVTEQGDHEALVASEGLYSRLYKLQAAGYTS